MHSNAKLAKEQIKQEITSQMNYIETKEKTFYSSLISNPTNYSIREQATFLATCRATLKELQYALSILEKEFPTRNLEREFDIYGDMANEFNHSWQLAEEEDEALDEQEQGL